MLGIVDIIRLGSVDPPYITTAALTILKHDFRKTLKDGSYALFFNSITIMMRYRWLVVNSTVKKGMQYT